MVGRLLFLGALLSCAPGLAAQEGRPAPFVLTHVTVIDGTGSPAQPDMTVSVSDGHIVAIVPSKPVVSPRGALVIDGTGKFLIPGLWDMHVHLTEFSGEDEEKQASPPTDSRAYYFPLLIANGVLGVRDMAGDLDTLLAFRREVLAGELLGPRLFITGYKLGSAKPVVRGAPAPVVTPDQARQAIRLLKQQGADFVKLDLGTDVSGLYPVVAEESRKQGLTFVGHVPLSVNAGDAAAFGEHSIEHLMQVPLSCSSEEAGLRRRLNALRPTAGYWARLMGWRMWYRGLPHEYAVSDRIAATYDEAKAARLFQRFVQSDSWQVPTLFLERDRALHLPGDGPEIERRFGLADKIRRPSRPFTPENSSRSEAYYRRELSIVGAMHRAGVGLLAGTDMPTAHAIPGFSLHEELALMVESGLSPLEALQTATLNPARFLGMADSLGTVQQGKVADLLLLDADPLADIGNLDHIHAVIIGGRVLDRARLDGMLSEVEGRVRTWNGGVISP